MPRGGYQKPTNPAPVSGPGRLSRRTDGGPGDRQPMRHIPAAQYGDGQATDALQGAAPMAAAPGTPNPGAARPPEALPTRLTEPTRRPAEPVSAGAPWGPGPGRLPGAADVEGGGDHVAATIRAAAEMWPSPALARMVARLDAEGR